MPGTQHFTRAARDLLAIAAVVFGLSAAAAQDYPSRPIRLIVPFAAGGPVDILARAIAPAMSAELKQPMIIENRAGGGGATGVDGVAKAAPDGYTIGLTGPGALVAIPFMTKVPYDVSRDIVPVARVVRVDAVILVAANSEYKTLADLLTAARTASGKLSFGSAGAGTTTHLAGELLNMEANVKLVHVPYRGAAPASNDLLGGHIATMIPDLPGVMGLITAGSARVLAVTSPTRSVFLPEVPTTAEAGLPKVVSDGWYGLIAPAGVPAEVMSRLNTAVATALKSAAVEQQITKLSAIPAFNTPQEFAALIAEEQARWKRVIEVTGAKLE
jgi:tripartite-type tricarboxylate transporter receptor subunit TctC